MSFEEPTQRLTVQPRDPAQTSPTQTSPTQTTPTQTTAALPRPLDLAGPTPSPSPDEPVDPVEPVDKTGELSLDEIFADAPPPASPPPASPPPVTEPARAEEAPTWTAMPVIPVRSEPTAPPASTSAAAETAQTPPKRTGPSTGERLRSDAAAAWGGAVRRSRAWLTHNDNGLMLMTAIVAIILILVVAAVGS